MTFRKAINFLRHDIWHIHLGSVSRKKSFLIRLLRVIVLALHGLDEDRCSLRASALTFYSMLSIVPVAALTFGMAKWFGLQKILENELLEKGKGQEEIISWVITFANSLLEDAKGGLIAGVGIVMLLWLIIRLLGNIEKSFNEIWGVQNRRQWHRRLSNYLLLMCIYPIVFILSSSTIFFITAQFTVFAQKIGILTPFSPMILLLLKILSYFLIWLLFIFLYILMPNTKVRILSGITGGIVACTIYTIVQWLYISFQIGVSKYGAIYGSFAALPLFMIWLQISWFIVLFGAEVSFAFQNVEAYEFEPISLKLSPTQKKILSLEIAHLCISNFRNYNRTSSAEQISSELKLPIRLTNRILFELEECGILAKTTKKNNLTSEYHPAQDIDSITINSVIQAIDDFGTRDMPLNKTSSLNTISECIKKFRNITEDSDANILLKDI